MELHNALSQRSVKPWLRAGGARDGAHVAPVNEDEATHKSRFLRRKSCCHKGAHRVADDKAFIQAHGPHRRRDVAGVLLHSVWTVRFVGISTASEIQRQQRASAT